MRYELTHHEWTVISASQQAAWPDGCSAISVIVLAFLLLTESVIRKKAENPS
jgi:hypothetical protein